MSFATRLARPSLLFPIAQHDWVPVGNKYSIVIRTRAHSRAVEKRGHLTHI
jgi:hypothetical protein